MKRILLGLLLSIVLFVGCSTAIREVPAPPGPPLPPPPGVKYIYPEGPSTTSAPKPTSTSDPSPTLATTPAPASDPSPTLAPTPVSYKLVTSVNPPGGGSVRSPSGEYNQGEQKKITATPSFGYTFDHWTGDASGKNATITITMDSNRTVVANFTIIPSPDVELKVGPPNIEGSRKNYIVTITNHNSYNVSVNLAKKVVNLQGVTVESSQWLEILDIWPEESYYTQISCGSGENLTLALSGLSVDIKSVGPPNLARSNLPSTSRVSEDITVLETMPISTRHPEYPANVTIKNNSSLVKHVMVVKIRLYDSEGRLLGVNHKTFGTPGWEFQPLESWMFTLERFNLRYNPDPPELKYVVRVFE